MKLFGKLGDRLTLVAVRVLLRELRLFRQTMKEGIDTYRLVHGQPPLYSQPEPTIESTRAADRKGFIREGDFLTPYLLQELAYQYHVPIDSDTDLEALAVERGWVDDAGKLLMLPLGVRMDGAMLREQGISVAEGIR